MTPSPSPTKNAPSPSVPSLDFLAGSGLMRVGLEPDFRPVWANYNCRKKAAPEVACILALAVRPRPGSRGEAERRPGTTVDKLIRVAIRERRLLEFMLHGLRRVAEPHIYGLRRGARQLLVYQLYGQSRSGNLPSWRTADLRQITHLRVLDERFESARLNPDEIVGWEKIFERVG